MTPDQILPGTDDTIGSLRQTLSTIPLPVEKKHRDHLVAFMETDLLGLTDLAQEIIRVPVAALHICRAAGEMARNKDIDILTLEQACGLLGTQRVGNLLKNLPTAEREDLPLAYRQLISISEHALVQASGLFSNRMSKLWHEMSLGCLLFLAPCWVLIYHRPELFADWDRQHLGGLVQEKDRASLNSDALLTLAQLLAQDWWLPPWILQGYRSLSSSRRIMVKALHIARDAEHPQDQQAALDDDLRLSRWLTQPANSLLLANGIALGAHHDWQARHTHRWQQLTALYLGCAVTDIQQASHMHAVESAGYLSDSQPNELWRPAESLIWPRGTRRHTNQSATETPRSSHVPGANGPALPNPALWRSHCQELVSSPSPFKSLPDVLGKMLQALTQGLSARQSWVALYNTREAQLVIGASAGVDGRIAGTRLGACQDNEWGSWLLAAPCHAISEVLLAENSIIPEEVRRLILSAGSFLLPIAPRGKLLGLLFVSFGDDNLLPEKQREPALIKTMDCLYKALALYRPAP